MICTSIQDKTLSEITFILSNPDVEMAEIRLDLCPALSLHDIETLFSKARIPLLATCRISPDITENEATHKLETAIKSGAAFADVELEASAEMATHISKVCKDNHCRFIRSVHFFNGTPSVDVLQECVLKCEAGYADIIKIVTYAGNADDVKVVQKLYTPSLAGTLIAFCMGNAGKQSRMDALKYGAPFTYAALSEKEATAAGQWIASDMYLALYECNHQQYGFNNKNIELPSSKSIAQRAIIAAMLSNGESALTNYYPCEDSESAITLIRNLGAEASISGSTLKINGGLSNIPNSMFVGESGFLTRFITPILSLSGRQITVNGEKTLVGRPLKGIIETMDSFGVEIDKESVPFTIKGKLSSGGKTVSGEYGSQIISGLLAALPLLPNPSEITISDPKSVPYLFMTIDVLKEFGIKMSNHYNGNNLIISICGNQTYKPANIQLESDWSSAAPILIAGAVFTGITLNGLNLNSVQADKQVIDILQDAGAVIKISDTAITVSKSPLHSFKTDLNNAPDLFPVVSVLAAFSEGESEIDGLSRLSGKESDRAKAITEMLAKLGVKCSQNGDTLAVQGHSLSYRYANTDMLNAGSYTSSNDHRMVMALKIAELGASGKIEIDNTECVAKSFPKFNHYFSK